MTSLWRQIESQVKTLKGANLRRSIFIILKVHIIIINHKMDCGLSFLLENHFPLVFWLIGLQKLSKNQPVAPLLLKISHRDHVFWIPRHLFNKKWWVTFSSLFLNLPKWAILETYPNLPKFRIDDVIPEVVLIFGSRDQYFWIPWSFLRQKWSSHIFLS